MNDEESRKNYIKILDSLDTQESELFELKCFIEGKKEVRDNSEYEKTNKDTNGEGNGSKNKTSSDNPAISDEEASTSE